MRSRFVLLMFALLAPTFLFAQQKKTYLAPDEHTDFLWSANERNSYVAFIAQLDYFLGQIASTSGEAARTQAKFSTDGSLRLKTYRDGSSEVPPAVAQGANWNAPARLRGHRAAVVLALDSEVDAGDK